MKEGGCEVPESYSIVLRGITKKMDRFTLGPIDLEIPAGYVTAIVGPNSSGKSTLLRIICNLMNPDEGDVEVLGRNYAEDDVELRNRVGFMPDSYDLIDDSMSLRKVVKFVSPFYTRWDVETYRRLVEKFRIDERKKFHRMSKGMAQKSALALTLAQSPELLLLDEPSGGLDPLAWQDMIDEIHRFMERESHTVLIATHIIEEVHRLADYIVFMSEGKVLGTYEKDRLLEECKEIWLADGKNDLSGINGIWYRDVQQPNRIITGEYTEVARELARRGIPVWQTHSLSLDEIMRYMIKNSSTDQS